jgi:hypothetical protein
MLTDPERVKEIVAKIRMESLEAAERRWLELLGSFVRGLNPEITKSTFPFDLGSNCGKWEVTFTRTDWGENEVKP